MGYLRVPLAREYRRQTARFFTPRRVDAEYRGLMHRIADVSVAAANIDPGMVGDRPG